MSQNQDTQLTQNQAKAIGRDLMSSCIQGAIGGALLPGTGALGGCLAGMAVTALVSSIAPSTAK